MKKLEKLVSLLLVLIAIGFFFIGVFVIEAGFLNFDAFFWILTSIYSLAYGIIILFLALCLLFGLFYCISELLVKISVKNVEKFLNKNYKYNWSKPLGEILAPTYTYLGLLLLYVLASIFSAYLILQFQTNGKLLLYFPVFVAVYLFAFRVFSKLELKGLAEVFRNVFLVAIMLAFPALMAMNNGFPEQTLNKIQKQYLLIIVATMDMFLLELILPKIQPKLKKRYSKLVSEIKEYF